MRSSHVALALAACFRSSRGSISAGADIRSARPWRGRGSPWRWWYPPGEVEPTSPLPHVPRIARMVEERRFAPSLVGLDLARIVRSASLTTLTGHRPGSAAHRLRQRSGERKLEPLDQPVPPVEDVERQHRGNTTTRSGNGGMSSGSRRLPSRGAPWFDPASHHLPLAGPRRTCRTHRATPATHRP